MAKRRFGDRPFFFTTLLRTKFIHLPDYIYYSHSISSLQACAIALRARKRATKKQPSMAVLYIYYYGTEGGIPAPPPGSTGSSAARVPR
jgi:hypothetical protein